MAPLLCVSPPQYSPSCPPCRSFRNSKLPQPPKRVSFHKLWCLNLEAAPEAPNQANVRRSKAKTNAAKDHSPWRLFDVVVSAEADPGKDDYTVHQPLCEEVSRRLRCKTTLPAGSISVVRKSFDARPGRVQWVYIVDVSNAAVRQAAAKKLSRKQGRLERVTQDSVAAPPHRRQEDLLSRTKVVVVGSGPAGLFAALTLAEAGVKVVLLERGQPVESRGRDIGALFVRKHLDPDSNLCYGEGGAGTWSDGKLTTRVGRNRDPVRRVLHTLHKFGAPESILLSGKPHLGTDRLVRILKAFRCHLQQLGVDIRFGSCVSKLSINNNSVCGVVLQGGEKLSCDAVVLAVGHSSRALYRHLWEQGVQISSKPFAMGFRIEHPQELINRIQYGAQAAAEVRAGRGKLPVADYRLTARVPANKLAGYVVGDEGGHASTAERGVYSFCMCPGGQIVPTSTNPHELCINGMSFSRRHSVWANSAVVVSVDTEDWRGYEEEHGTLAGMELQRVIEREAALRGGGELVAPVQRVTDFLRGITSRETSLPSSSYRLGVRSAPLHDLYPPALSASIRTALDRFERILPGFTCEYGLLHGVETRTSAPIRIDRGVDCQSVGTGGLYPCGEGGGYAGGIVSSAVDGMQVAEALMQKCLDTREVVVL